MCNKEQTMKTPMSPQRQCSASGHPDNNKNASGPALSYIWPFESTTCTLSAFQGITCTLWHLQHTSCTFSIPVAPGQPPACTLVSFTHISCTLSALEGIICILCLPQGASPP